MRVVVDHGPLDGGADVLCAGNGADRPVADVMSDVGVEITWVQRYPGAFVCRLDGRPTDLPCADTPPADRFWGLFWAGPADRRWSYSTEGASSLAVPGGGSIGWRFQDGGEREVPTLRPWTSTVPGGGPSSDRPATSTDDESSTAGRGTLAGLIAIAGLGVVGLLVARRRS